MDQAIDRPRFACAACRRLKKKCDRREPQCTHCVKNRRQCAYSDASLNEVPIRVPTNRSSSPSSETGSGYFEDNIIRFPEVYFLDSDLFQRSISKLPTDNIALHADLKSYIGNKSSMRDHATTFFTKIHPWFPFISKRVFYEGVLSALMPTQAEHIMLLGAVKLVTTSPKTQDARSMIYKHMKATFMELEVIGQLTLRTLQALTLIALYELGHGIYPTAYMTIGQCARYGIALGLDQKIGATVQRSWNPVDLEEERRTWWAIVILDRFVHLGCPEKTPVTAEPMGDSVLPIDDQLWDTNETPISVHTLSSPPTPAMGRFGLTVQAGILLGRALRNLRDASTMLQDSSLAFQNEEAEVLENAIFALAKVSSEEAQIRGIGICGLTKLCYSAILILNTRATKLKKHVPNLIPAGEDGNIKEKNLYIASRLRHIGKLDDTLTYLGTREEISPFLLDSIYRSAIIYMQEYLSSGDQDLLNAANEFRSALEKINERWKAAGVYLQLLEAHDMADIMH